MATTVHQFQTIDEKTGEVIYPPSKVDRVTGTTTVAILTGTQVVAITTDSATLTVATDGVTANAGDLAPPARGYFQMRTKGQAFTLNLTGAGS
jgi:hypothetical protein